MININPIIYIIVLMLIAFALGALLTLLLRREPATKQLPDTSVNERLSADKSANLEQQYLEKGHDPLDLAHAYYEMGEHQKSQQLLSESMRSEHQSIQQQAAQKWVAWYG